MEELGVLDQIEAKQGYKNQDIYDKAAEIL
jgi:hypothetical protein